ncbi:MAG: N-acetylmuramoyl-L-alanine amidase [Oryzihumus sp.]
MTYQMILGNPQHMSGPNGPITRIVLHGTVSPCVAGGAVNVAHYFQSADAGGLAHFVVDPSEIVQCCPEDTACWHAPPNHGSLGVELCDPQAGPDARWSDAPHAAMLHRAAVLVADLCKRHGVPTEYVNAPGLVAGKHGITMHSDVSAAFHQSTHVDPGSAFPMAQFIALVKAASAPPPPPKPAPAKPVAVLPKEHRMIVRFDGAPHVFEVVGSHLEHITAQAYGAQGAPLVTQLPASHPLAALPKVGL